MNLAGAQHVAFRNQLAAQFGHRVSSHPLLSVAADAFVRDPLDYYNAYINGRITFAEHRIGRVLNAMEILKLHGEPDDQLWVADYEDIVSQHWAPFDDAKPLLEALDELGIKYGAVTNHTTDHQAHKLESAGLPFDVVVGTDVTGKPKPHASMFLEGVLQLGSDPANTMMIGDDVNNDGRGARDAGLISTLLDRDNALVLPERVHKIRSLSDVLHKGPFRFDNTII